MGRTALVDRIRAGYDDISGGSGRRRRRRFNMTAPISVPTHAPRDRVIVAVVLIAIGVIGLLSQLVTVPDEIEAWAVFVIGLVLLVAFAVTRAYGYLIPGGIMTGLGIGILVAVYATFATDEATGGAVVLGLGLGFISIWVIGALTHVHEHHWWPFIPGGILTTVGLALFAGEETLLGYWWVVLIGAGLVILWRSLTGRGSSSAGV
jgi:hypothetical protein